MIFYKDWFKKATVLPCLIPSSSPQLRILGLLPGATQDLWPVEEVLRKVLRKAQGSRSVDNMAVGHVDEPGRQFLPAIHNRRVFRRVVADAAKL